ncbi:MAG: hypothetical protein K0U98_09730 [Deltaproteobacteria bacterium]|nr:hypothetical protein [Deltaproteobacteria bacterium]
MADSSEVGDSLRDLQDAGCSLYLLVDCQRDGSPREQLTLPTRRRTPEPTFQINGTDLTFFKSIGIDPTRRLRRRRST